MALVEPNKQEIPSGTIYKPLGKPALKLPICFILCSHSLLLHGPADISWCNTECKHQSCVHHTHAHTHARTHTRSLYIYIFFYAPVFPTQLKPPCPESNFLTLKEIFSEKVDPSLMMKGFSFSLERSAPNSTHQKTPRYTGNSTCSAIANMSHNNRDYRVHCNCQP